VAQLVEAMQYKSEGRGFDSRLCHWPRYGPGVDSASNRNETSAHILCECEALASFRHVYLGSLFVEPDDIKSIRLGAIWNLVK
jgi:hypothetical protein